jgi:hypothetical protein
MPELDFVMVPTLVERKEGILSNIAGDKSFL